MKRTGIIILIGIILIILLSSCSTQQRVVYRDCNCNNVGLGFGWNYNPYWGWNDPFWGWGWRNQIVIVPQRFRQVPPPTRYDRRRIIMPPQSVRPSSRSITPVPHRRGYNEALQPTRRYSLPQNRTVPQNRNVPQRQPIRSISPSMRSPQATPNNLPSRGNRSNMN